MQLDICRNKTPVIFQLQEFCTDKYELACFFYVQKPFDNTPVIDLSRSFIMLGLPYFDMMCAIRNYIGKVKKVKNAKMQLQEFYSEKSIIILV